MSVRRSRTRLFAATAVALVALTTLTACEDGEGVRDEGPSSTSARSEREPGPALPEPGSAPGQAHSMRAASVAQ
ncbi:hypothetical protein ACKI1I_45115 [Streptomyces turgidiscabies]|uniref:Lipoprotein n=1 Tax=Streptomyces turgidiscabies (strain Car8) TaxID=698760 RepID=L7FIP2_STRT8|nr:MULTISPECIES: hypothetical protein [Streptomyces]ELP71253.1 hypothetical protein STRTUCAR8_04808 [Streptomyces turgidiscabies Car8]MDX3498786.1 hypothetical protein [Streptomyces turgidiscabies]GAQ74786.1 hypothetical protein T45_06566 [Streptomyces turgidiscabies]